MKRFKHAIWWIRNQIDTDYEWKTNIDSVAEVLALKKQLRALQAKYDREISHTMTITNAAQRIERAADRLEARAMYVEKRIGLMGDEKHARAMEVGRAAYDKSKQ